MSLAYGESIKNVLRDPNIPIQEDTTKTSVAPTMGPPPPMNIDVFKVSPLGDAKLGADFEQEVVPRKNIGVKDLGQIVAGIQRISDTLTNPLDSIVNGLSGLLTPNIDLGLDGELLEDISGLAAAGTKIHKAFDAATKLAKAIPVPTSPVDLHSEGPISNAMVSDTSLRTNFQDVVDPNNVIEAANTKADLAVDIHQEAKRLKVLSLAGSDLADATELANREDPAALKESLQKSIQSMLNVMASTSMQVDAEHQPSSTTLQAIRFQRQQRATRSFNTRVSDLKARIQQAKVAASGAMPGNLLHAGYGDGPAAADPRTVMSQLPDKLINRIDDANNRALALNITKNTDKSYDKLVAQLPYLLASRRKRMSRSVQLIVRLVAAMQRAIALTTADVQLIKDHIAEIGSIVLDFIQLSRSGVLAPLDTLAERWSFGRLTRKEEQTLDTLLGQFDVVSRSTDPSIITIATGKTFVQTAKDEVEILVVPFTETFTGLVADGAAERDQGDEAGQVGDYWGAMFLGFQRMLNIVTGANLLDAVGDRLIDIARQMSAWMATLPPWLQAIVAPFVSILAAAIGLTGLVIKGLAAVLKNPVVQAIIGAALIAGALLAMLSQFASSLPISSKKLPAKDVSPVKEAEGAASQLASVFNKDTADALQASITKGAGNMGRSVNALAETAKTGDTLLGVSPLGVTPLSEALQRHQSLLRDEIRNLSFVLPNLQTKANGTQVQRSDEAQLHILKMFGIKAGAIVSFEAPVLSSTVRFWSQNAAVSMLSVDAHNLRAQTAMTHVETMHGLVVGGDDLTLVEGKKAVSAGEHRDHTMGVREISSKEKVLISVEGGGQILIDGGQIVLTMGTNQIKMANGVISINPVTPDPMEPVLVRKDTPPAMIKTNDKKQPVLPSLGPRNPVPVAIQYDAQLEGLETRIE